MGIFEGQFSVNCGCLPLTETIDFAIVELLLLKPVE